jgi:hypothetical protein
MPNTKISSMKPKYLKKIIKKLGNTRIKVFLYTSMTCIEQTPLKPWKQTAVKSLAHGCNGTQKRSCAVTVGTSGCVVSKVLLSHRAQGKWIRFILVFKRFNVLNNNYERKIRLGKNIYFLVFKDASMSLRM